MIHNRQLCEIKYRHMKYAVYNSEYKTYIGPKEYKSDLIIGINPNYTEDFRVVKSFDVYLPDEIANMPNIGIICNMCGTDFTKSFGTNVRHSCIEYTVNIVKNESLIGWFNNL